MNYADIDDDKYIDDDSKLNIDDEFEFDPYAESDDRDYKGIMSMSTETAEEGSWENLY